MATAALFNAIVADLNVVHAAYERAGFLAGTGQRTPSGGPATMDHPERVARDVLLLDALVRNRVARLVLHRDGPRHIVVFGGNNVGKSTVVNILVAASMAGTSPEGGHTRHAQAFTAARPPLFAWNPHAFARFREIPADQLSGQEFDSYAVSPIAAGPLPDDVVVWDSPDCDSVGSTRYLAAVVEAVTVADLVVYVTSVEKYAVADLVEWAFDLHDAGIPILECLNKTPAKDRQLVMRRQAADVFPAMAKRLALAAPALPVVALRYMTAGEEPDLWGDAHPEAEELRSAALANLPSPTNTAQAQLTLRSVRRRVERVLGPAREELAVQAVWKATVAAAVAAFIAAYDNQYLSGGSVVNPFKKLNAELLELLNPDIPHLGQVIRGLRAVQRIPTDFLKAVWRRGALLVSQTGEGDAQLAPGLRAYAAAHQALLMSLSERIEIERKLPRHHRFWDRLAENWDDQVARLAEEFSRTTLAHMERTDAEVRLAAQDILQALRQRPAVLALLKAARISTDIGGLLIGFAIPGHGGLVHDLLQDIVIAPAMLGATGFAADYAVEGYVAQRRNQVIDKLRADAREMATTLYTMPLGAIGDAAMASIGTLGLAQGLLDRLPANLLLLENQVAGMPA